MKNAAYVNIMVSNLQIFLSQKHIYLIILLYFLKLL